MSPATLLLAWMLSMDGGAATTPVKAPPTQTAPALSDEDKEVVQHLELLESLDAASDLDMLEELSVER